MDQETKTYPLAKEKWVRALRYPFVNPKRDFFCRIFNMEFAPDGQKVPYTTNVAPETVKIEKSGTMDSGLAPKSASKQKEPISTYTVTCETEFGTYTAENRIPLLAIGSNSSDEQLNRKFKNTSYNNDALIMPAWLNNYSVVYMPIIAPYGSVAATVYPTPGVPCRVTIGFFNMTQAQDIIGTESPYDVRRLHDNAELDNGIAFNDSLAFVSAHGILSFDGRSLLRIKEIPHEGDHVDDYIARTQYEVQEDVMKQLGTNSKVKDFILSHLNDQQKRQETDHTLQKNCALPFTEGENTTIIIPGRRDPEENYRQY